VRREGFRLGFGLGLRLVVVGMVYEKMKIFNFFESAQKRSNFSENDIDIYIRHFVKYGAKLPSQKKVIRVQS
jgi:hypothetical protein